MNSYLVYQFTSPADNGFTFDRALLDDFPFGGTLETPEAWLIDAKGHTGTLRREAGRLRLERLGRDANDKLIPKAQAVKHFTLGRDSWTIDEPPTIDEGLPWVVGEQLHNVADEKWTPSMAFRPGLDETELTRLITWLNGNPTSLKVKAGGSRHSWSRVAATSGAYLHPEGMRCLEPGTQDATLQANLPPTTTEHLFRIGAGTVIREINDDLWENKQKAFGVLGGYDGQTLAGVLPTGTHGSVLSHGPLAEMVRSMDLIAGTGEPLRIEPYDGPTDPIAFHQARPNTRLIKDNETFDAALIHLGTIGVIRSLLVEVSEKFYLTEVRTREPIGHVLAALQGGGIYHLFDKVIIPPWALPDHGQHFTGHKKPAYHLEFLIYPLRDFVIVTTREPTQLDIPEPPFFRERPERNLFRLLATPAHYRRGIGVVWFSENFHDAIAALSQRLMEDIHSLAPTIVGNAMNSLKYPGYLQRSYRVFDIGDGQNAIPNLTATIYVTLRDDLYLRAIELIRCVGRELAAQGKYQTGPISIRFIRHSRAMLGDPEDDAAFEFIFVGHTPWAKDMVDAYDKALRTHLGAANVRFHWGHYMPTIEQTRILENYPRYQAWRQIRDTLDPTGRYINDWQERILPPSETTRNR